MDRKEYRQKLEELRRKAAKPSASAKRRMPGHRTLSISARRVSARRRPVARRVAARGRRRK